MPTCYCDWAEAKISGLIPHGKLRETVASCEIYIQKKPPRQLEAMWELRLFTYSVPVRWEKKIYIFMQLFLFQGKYNNVDMFLLATHLTVYFEQLCRRLIASDRNMRSWHFLAMCRCAVVDFARVCMFLPCAAPFADLTQRVCAWEWSAQNHHPPVWLEVQLYLIVFLALLEFSMGLTLRREMG